MAKRRKLPYCVRYNVKDRFDRSINSKATFETFDKAQRFALRVSKIENNTGGGSAKLLSWGRNR